MSDNINVTPGTGATIAAESLSGALVQRIKMVLGNTDVDNGDISATNPMPITGSITATNLSIGATGSAVPADATMIGGTDGTNLRAFSVSSSGVLNVNGSSFTQPVSGSVVVSQSTGSNLHVAIDSLPSLPAGANTIGAVTQASGPWTQNLTQISGSAFVLGQATMAGSLPIAIASNQSAIPVTQSGTWSTGRTWTLASGTDSVSAVQSGTWTVQPGNTANTTPWLTTINQGGNSASVTGSNALKVDGSAVTQPVSGTVTANQGGAPWTVTGTGTAGTPAAGIITIQGNASGTPVPISGSITATNLSIGATGTTPPADATYVGGAVTTAAPSYTTGQMNALSLNLSGGLRVDGSGVTQPVSGTVTANAGTGNFTVVQSTASNLNANVSGTVTANQGGAPWSQNLTQISGSAITLGQTTMASSLPVTIASNQSALPVSQSGTWTVQPGNTANTTPWLVTVSTALPAGSNNIGSIANITGTVSLPTGASTSALQTSGNASLTTIAGTVLSQGSTTSGETGILQMGAVTTAAPSYTTGQTNPLSLTPVGALRVDGSAITQPVSGTVTANAGTGSFTVAQPTASNLNATVSIAAAQTLSTVTTVGAVTAITNALPAGSNVIGGVTQSGTWTVQQGTPPWTIQGDSASGSTAAGNPVQVGGVFNTTQPTVTTGQSVAAQATSRGALIVSTGVDSFNINNITGTVPLPTGAATSANQTSIIGSSTGGTAATNSQLIGGIFDSTLPVLTNGQQAAIQLDSSGRIIPGFYPSQSNSGTIAGNGNILALGGLNGYQGITLAINGTWSSTLTLVGSNDGTNYFTVTVISLSNPAAGPQTTITTNGMYYAPVSYPNLELVSSAYVSGTVSCVATFHTLPTTISGSGTGTDLDKSISGTIAALNGTLVLPINGISTVNISISGTWSATLAFEGQSGDGIWNAIAASNPAGGDNVTTATTNNTYTVGVGGFTQVRVIATAYTSGTAAITMNGSSGDQQTLAVDANGNQQQVGDSAAGTADSGSNPVKIGGVYESTAQTLTSGQRGTLQLDPRSFLITTPVDGFKQTYSMSTTVALAATATDVVTIVGSATKTVRVLQIRVSGISTTAITTPVLLIKRSAANTGGTSTAMTQVPHDSNNAAATATGAAYTVNPTGLGAAVGTIRQDRLSFAVTGSVAENPLEWNLGNKPGQAIVLRGTAQVLAVNLNSTTVTGGSISVSIEWTEE